MPGENQFPQIASDLHKCCQHEHTYTCTQDKFKACNLKKIKGCPNNLVVLLWASQGKESRTRLSELPGLSSIFMSQHEDRDLLFGLYLTIYNAPDTPYWIPRDPGFRCRPRGTRRVTPPWDQSPDSTSSVFSGTSQGIPRKSGLGQSRKIMVYECQSWAQEHQPGLWGIGLDMNIVLLTPKEKFCPREQQVLPTLIDNRDKVYFNEGWGTFINARRKRNQ